MPSTHARFGTQRTCLSAGQRTGFDGVLNNGIAQHTRRVPGVQAGGVGQVDLVAAEQLLVPRATVSLRSRTAVTGNVYFNRT